MSKLVYVGSIFHAHPPVLKTVERDMFLLNNSDFDPIRREVTYALALRGRFSMIHFPTKLEELRVYQCIS